MSDLSFLDKLLDGVEVEWRPLGEVTNVLRGKRLTKSQLIDGADYPVFHGGLEPLGHYAESNRPANTVMIINVGASAGTVGYSSVDFWSSDGCFCLEKNEFLNGRYLYFAVIGHQNVLRSKVRVAGIPTLDAVIVEKLQIPIPCPDNPKKSLEIQSEIVRILDNFTELTARKKQYNYYRDQLLSFGDDVPVVQLSRCCLSIADGDHQAPPKTDVGIPFITISNVSDSNLIDLTNTRFVPQDYYDALADKRKARKNDILYTVVGSFGIPVFISDNKQFAFQRHIAILRPNQDLIISKYLYHVLTSSDFLKQAFAIAVGAAQKTITLEALNKMKVPMPSLAEQARIVAILDKFDAMTNSITEGLPREIELRQKQYEHYRDLLLSFPKAQEVTA